jgi:3-ketosteroid 9alpha-monooxygenase subunit A
MKFPYTWRPTGWFMIGWSAEFPVGTSKPLKYFGQELAAYRTEAGALHVLDAHCPHLGAHLGHGGKVVDDCIACPYHGWTWGPDGTNRSIPYEDRPNVSKTIRSWEICEQHECVFMWHDPAGGPPRWELPDIFTMKAEMPATADQYYRAYPEMSIKYDREPVHPQITLENGPDSIHFKYVHDATVDPYLMKWEVVDHEWQAMTGWPKAGAPDGVALKLHARLPGVGGSFVIFEGAENYRLIFFTTPVDDDTSDMFYSVWWPRGEGDSSVVPPEALSERVRKETLSSLGADLEIWRYQVYIETPAFAQQDARPYGAIRKWARQFYEIDPVSA